MLFPTFGGFDVELGIQVRRCPKKEEPPHSIRHKLTECKCPGLSVGETLPESHTFLFLVLFYSCCVGFMFVLLDIFELAEFTNLFLEGAVYMNTQIPSTRSQEHR